MLPLLVLAGAGLLFGGGLLVRSQIPVELSVESLERVRAWVLEFGWQAPALFVALVTFRVFLLLPSALVLTLGGLAFGTVEATALGTAGIAISSAYSYAAARVFGVEWVAPRLGAGLWQLVARIRRAGPWLVGLATAHPAGPMTPFHLAAGVTNMSVVGFALAIAVGGPLRAGAYALLGSSLLDWGLVGSALTALAIGAVALLPFAHAGFRARVFGTVDHRAHPASPPSSPGGETRAQ